MIWGRRRVFIASFAIVVVATFGLAAPAPPVGALEGPPQRIVIELTDGRARPAADVAEDAGGDVARGDRRAPSPSNCRPPAGTTPWPPRGRPSGRQAEPRRRLPIAAVPTDPCYLGCAGFDQYNLRSSAPSRPGTLTQGSPPSRWPPSTPASTPPTSISTARSRSAPTPPPAPTARRQRSRHPRGRDHRRAHRQRSGRGRVGLEHQRPSIKVLDDDGAGFGSDIAKGIYEAMRPGAKVINLSLAGQLTPPFEVAVPTRVQRRRRRRRRGRQRVARGRRPIPAGYDGVIGVAATNAADQIAGFSNMGTWVDLGAPGDTIVSTFPPGGGCLELLRDRVRHVAVVTSGGCRRRPDAGRQPQPLGPRPWPRSSTRRLPRSLARAKRASAGRSTPARPCSRRQPARLACSRPGYRMVATRRRHLLVRHGPFLGSTGNITLNQPIVGMARTPTGKGYWMVAATAASSPSATPRFQGSTAASPLDAADRRHGRDPDRQRLLARRQRRRRLHLRRRRLPRVQATSGLTSPSSAWPRTPDGNGYWLVAADGGIFAFGDAAVPRLDRRHPPQQADRRHGRHPGGNGLLAGRLRRRHLRLRRRPLLRIDRQHRAQQADRRHGPDPTGNGYWLVASDGGIFAFGDAPFFGSTGASRSTSRSWGCRSLVVVNGGFDGGEVLGAGDATGPDRSAPRRR